MIKKFVLYLGNEAVQNYYYYHDLTAHNLKMTVKLYHLSDEQPLYIDLGINTPLSLVERFLRRLQQRHIPFKILVAHTSLENLMRNAAEGYIEDKTIYLNKKEFQELILSKEHFYNLTFLLMWWQNEKHTITVDAGFNYDSKTINDFLQPLNYQKQNFWHEGIYFNVINLKSP